MNIRQLVGFAAALLITVSESAAFSSPVLATESRVSAPAAVEVTFNDAVPEIVVTASRLP